MGILRPLVAFVALSEVSNADDGKFEMRSMAVTANSKRNHIAPIHCHKERRSSEDHFVI